jgi:hypothetical protein
LPSATLAGKIAAPVLPFYLQAAFPVSKTSRPFIPAKINFTFAGSFKTISLVLKQPLRLTHEKNY